MPGDTQIEYNVSPHLSRADVKTVLDFYYRGWFPTGSSNQFQTLQGGQQLLCLLPEGRPVLGS